MSNGQYEYWGMMARLWDFFRGDTSTWGDRAFFLEAVHKYGGPVLDVGCGTGRLLVDFAAQGIEIEGVDNSPEMLDLCRAKAAALGLDVTVYQQEMQTLSLPRRYQTILVPSSSFQLLTNPADARMAISRFFDHLLPGGVLLMPFMQIWQQGAALDSGWELSGEKQRDEDGAILRRWSRSWFDPANQWESSEDRYEILVKGEVIESETHVQSPATRWYGFNEALALYQAAGFAEVEAFSDFTWQPAHGDERVIVVVGHK